MPPPTPIPTPSHRLCYNVSVICCRKRDKRNSLTYRRNLQSMKKRVEERALLLEQHSSGSSVEIARERYAAALKKIGLAEDEVQSVVE